MGLKASRQQAPHSPPPSGRVGLGSWCAWCEAERMACARRPLDADASACTETDVSAYQVLLNEGGEAHARLQEAQQQGHQQEGGVGPRACSLVQLHSSSCSKKQSYVGPLTVPMWKKTTAKLLLCAVNSLELLKAARNNRNRNSSDSQSSHSNHRARPGGFLHAVHMA